VPSLRQLDAMKAVRRMAADPAMAAGHLGRWLDRWAVPVFALIAASAFGALAWLGRHSTFFQDEWSFIRVSGFGTPADWLAPHNGHWSTIPFLIYRALMVTVGMHTYLPYLALLLAMHVLAAAGLFVLVRRSAGSLVALTASTVFLLLGVSWQNFFWAFQIGFFGSAAAGLWALAILDPGSERRRPWLAAVLLLVSIMCSGMGLPFLAAAVVEMLLDRRRRHEVGWPLAVGATYVIWYVAIGRSGYVDLGQLALSQVAGLPWYVIEGMVGSVHALIGVPPYVAALVAGTLAVAAVVRAWRRILDPRVVGAAAGLALLLVLIGVGRGGDGYGRANGPRYAYEVVALLLILTSALIGRRGDILPTLDEAWRYRPAFVTLFTTLLAGALVLGLYHNVPLLRSGAAFYREAAGELRAQMALADRYGNNLNLVAPASDRWSIPTPSQLDRWSAIYGSPAHDVLAPSDVLEPTAVERDRALWRLVGGTLAPVSVPGPASPAPGATAPAVMSVAGASLTSAGACDVLDMPSAGGAVQASIVVLVPDGAALLVSVDRAGLGAVGLGRELPPDSTDQSPITLTADRAALIRAPRLTDGSTFQVLLVLPAGTSAASVCTAA
jgi:hypothetical protein